MEIKRSIGMLLVALCLVLGLTMCKGGEQPAPVKKSYLALSTEDITLSATRVASLVTIKSTQDWKSDLKASLPRAEGALLPVSIGEKEWLRITPAMGKAGVTNMVVSVIQEKLPTESSSTMVKFTSIDGTLSRSLMVKYEPKK